jgi:hypothetical protein
MAVVHEPDFGAARDLFALYCKAKALSLRTLETYLASIDELRAFLAQPGRGGGIPLPQDIRAFVASLLDRSLARTTISIRLRSVERHTRRPVRWTDCLRASRREDCRPARPTTARLGAEANWPGALHACYANRDNGGASEGIRARIE